jgi:VWFA-related protein
VPVWDDPGAEELRKPFILALVAGLLAGHVWAGEHAAPPTFGAATQTVRVPVSVLDQNGDPVLDLGRESFRIFDSGRSQALTLFSSERRPIRIVVALDISLSMTPRMDAVQRALGDFIDLLEPADETLIITFCEQVFVHGEFTSDRDQLERVFAQLEPAPGTSLYDAAIEAIGRVATAPAESKAVVLVTDGDDTTSKAHLNDVRELARLNEVPIFGIGLGGGGGTLRPLADDSGGRAILLGSGKRKPGEPDPLKAAAASIALTLRHRYLLGFEAQGGGGFVWHPIRVDVDRPSAKVLVRKGYYPLR